MPKQRNKRKPSAAAPTAPRKQHKKMPRWIRYSAITVILMLMLSALVGALVSAPAHAATTSPTPSPTFSALPSCAPRDTDHDGIPNTIDTDIDGDGIPNGLDPDIDGDGIPNAQDNDPASTNCELSTTPPQNIKDAQAKQFADQLRIPAVIVIVLATVGYFVLRKRRAAKRGPGKIN